MSKNPTEQQEDLRAKLLEALDASSEDSYVYNRAGALIESLEALFTDELEKRERKTNDAGHFFVEKKIRNGTIDYGYYWFCKCGYKANGNDELDGHIKWQLAQLKKSQL